MCTVVEYDASRDDSIWTACYLCVIDGPADNAPVYVHKRPQSFKLGEPVRPHQLHLYRTSTDSLTIIIEPPCGSLSFQLCGAISFRIPYLNRAPACLYAV